MKKLIALLLVTIICLALVACNNESGNTDTTSSSGNTETPSSGENTENNGGVTNDNTTNKDDTPNDETTNKDDTANDTTNEDDNTTTEPEKIERGTVTTSENPLLPFLFKYLADCGWEYNFNNDGTCSETEYWWIEEDTKEKLVIFVSTEYEWKRKITFTFDGSKGNILFEEPIYNNNVFVSWNEWINDSDVRCDELKQNYKDMVNILCTEWKNTKGDTFVFRKDGTCAINGVEYKWERFSVYKDDVTTSTNPDGSPYQSNIASFVIVDNDGNDIDSIHPSLDQQGYYYLWTYSEEIFYKADQLEAVEITLDNFYDYFELTTVLDNYYDAFGDFSYTLYCHCFVNKKDLVFLNDTKVALEISYETQPRSATLNLENKEIIWGEDYFYWSYTNTRNDKFYKRLNYADRDQVLAFGIASDTMSLTDTQADFLKSYEIKRVAGTLYIINLD